MGLSDAIGAATRGIERANHRAHEAAETVARGGFEDVLAGTDDRAVLHGLLELPQARNQLFANAATVRAADEMIAEVLAATT